MNTYDILDAGPRNRFTVSDALVHNCTGSGPQPTNLPKAGPVVYLCGCGKHSSQKTFCTWCNAPRRPDVKTVEWCVEAVDDALQVLAARDLRTVEYHFGDAMLAVSGSLRGMFCAAEGKTLISSDFTAIEAVVLAALAGEQWRLDVFKAKTDIYLESISRSTGTPMSELVQFKKDRGMHHPLRAKGKIQELACGFGGWIGSLLAFGAEGSAEDMKTQLKAWRAASPNIVYLWGGQSQDFGRRPGMFGLEGAAVLAVQNPGQWFDVMRLDGTPASIKYGVVNDVLYCELPSGRFLSYHRPRLSPAAKAWRGLRLTFEGYNTNQKKGRPGWMTMDLYGGLLAENVTQAVARDILRNAMNELERRGYAIVLHVYDEIVAEVPIGFGSIEELETVMGTMPAWAEGWPISAAGGWSGHRYRKA